MDEAPPATAEELPEGRRQWRFRPPPGACKLLVVPQHGESLPRHPDLPVAMLDGQEDPDLDPRGHDEAERVGVRLAHVGLSAVYVSPLRRTSQTAAPLLRRTGLQPRVVDGLREVRLGEWEGGGWRHEEADRVIAAERWDVIPGAEPNESLEARVRSTLGAIAAAHPDQRVAVFTQPASSARRSLWRPGAGRSRSSGRPTARSATWSCSASGGCCAATTTPPTSPPTSTTRATTPSTTRRAPRRSHSGGHGSPGGHQCAATTSTPWPRIGVPSPAWRRRAWKAWCPAAAAQRR